MHAAYADPDLRRRVRAENAAAEAQREAARVLWLKVPASQLTQAEKNAVWRWIKQNNPELHAFLTDPQVIEILKAPGVSPCFDPELIRAAIAAATTEKVTPCNT